MLVIRMSSHQNQLIRGVAGDIKPVSQESSDIIKSKIIINRSVPESKELQNGSYSQRCSRFPGLGGVKLRRGATQRESWIRWWKNEFGQQSESRLGFTRNVQKDCRKTRESNLKKGFFRHQILPPSIGNVSDLAMSRTIVHRLSLLFFFHSFPHKKIYILLLQDVRIFCRFLFATV